MGDENMIIFLGSLDEMVEAFSAGCNSDRSDGLGHNDDCQASIHYGYTVQTREENDPNGKLQN